MFRVLIHTILQRQDLVKFTLSELSRESIDNYSLKLDGFQHGVKYVLLETVYLCERKRVLYFLPYLKIFGWGNLYFGSSLLGYDSPDEWDRLH